MLNLNVDMNSNTEHKSKLMGNLWQYQDIVFCVKPKPVMCQANQDVKALSLVVGIAKVNKF